MRNGWNSQSFLQDLGINYFGSDNSWCQTGFSSFGVESMYTNSIHMHSYVGETYRMVWQAKNYANYDCFNYIPDTSMTLYHNPNVNPSYPTSDGNSLSNDWELLHDMWYWIFNHGSPYATCFEVYVYTDGSSSDNNDVATPSPTTQDNNDDINDQMNVNDYDVGYICDTGEIRLFYSSDSSNDKNNDNNDLTIF